MYSFFFVWAYDIDRAVVLMNGGSSTQFTISTWPIGLTSFLPHSFRLSISCCVHVRLFQSSRSIVEPNFRNADE